MRKDNFFEKMYLWDLKEFKYMMADGIKPLADKQYEQVIEAYTFFSKKIEKDIVSLRCEKYRKFKMKINKFKHEIRSQDLYYEQDSGYPKELEYPVSLNSLI